MAQQQQQQQDFRQGQQHLALRQQDSDHQQGVLVPQVQPQHQRALQEVQTLERQRLGLAEAALEAHLAASAQQPTTWDQSAQAT